MKRKLFVLGMTALLILTASVGLASAADHPDPMVAPNTTSK